MKKWLLVMLFAPVFAMASDIYEENFSSEEEAETPTIQNYRCGAFSDHQCWGFREGSGCFIGSPPNTRWGICRQVGRPDRRGEVPCSCI